MHLVALVESIEHVCCRYRLRAFVDGLAAWGHRLDIQELPRKWARWRLGAGLRHADIVILQRKLLSRWQLALLRQRVGRLAFDFDDAVFQRDSYHRKGPGCPTLGPRFAATMRAVDLVIAGNNWLAEKAREQGAAAVQTIPTCIDVNQYSMADHRPSDNLILVWVGSRSTMQGLHRARPLLEHLGRTVPGLVLRMVCDDFLRFQHLQVERVPWSEAGEAAAIATADVGLSLLPDDDWSRGKCGLKVLQYLAAGVPVIGNPVGVTAELIGISRPAGLLAEAADDWVDALERLRDPELRRRYGQVGRRRVEERYSIAAGLSRWIDVIEQVPSARRAS